MISRYLTFVHCFIHPPPPQKKAIQKLDLLYKNALIVWPFGR